MSGVGAHPAPIVEPVDVMPDAAKRTSRDAGIDGALAELRRALSWQCETICDPDGRDRSVALAIDHAIGVLASVRGCRMTAAIIILAGALAGAIAGLIALGVWLNRAHADVAATHVDLVMEQRRGDSLELARDAALVAKAQADTTAREALRRLSAADTLRNDSIAKEAEHAATTVREGGSALDAFNRVLSQGDPDHATGPAAARDHDDGGAPAVSPATGADGAATGR